MGPDESSGQRRRGKIIYSLMYGAQSSYLRTGKHLGPRKMYRKSVGPFLLSKYLSILMDLKEQEGPLDGANFKSALVTLDTVC